MMIKQTRNIQCGLLTAVLLAPVLETKAQDRKPNIIFILADDMGYGDLACYGNPIIDTPNIDTLASEGRRFTHFYAGAAVSTPSRVSLMTGRFPIRYNVGEVFRDKNEYLVEEEVNLAKVLKAAGYATAHIGKWHLGGLRDVDLERRDEGIATSPGPMQQGFDHSLTSIEGKPIRAELMTSDRLYKEAGEHLIRDDQYAPEDNNHWEDIKTAEALRLMEEYSRGDKPFFINLWLDSPHAPYEATERHLDKYLEMGAEGYRANFYSMVAHIDENLGKIKSKLKELGIDDNTIIIFTSDNGPAHHGSAGPFKGAKTDLHEGGVRVPAIIWWNGVISSGVDHNCYHFTDFLPTLNTLGGGEPLPTLYQGDGEDISEALLSESIERRTRENRIFFIMNKGGNSQLQIPRPQPHPTYAVIDGKWKLTADIVDGELVALELYDLMSDQHELKNLLGKHPEIEKSLYDYMKQTLDEPRTLWDYELGYDENDDK
ncbi:MAG: sulfatase-like hydrolase/transferase [Rikenellaceae bacterium]